MLEWLSVDFRFRPIKTQFQDLLICHTTWASYLTSLILNFSYAFWKITLGVIVEIKLAVWTVLKITPGTLMYYIFIWIRKNRDMDKGKWCFGWGEHG